MGKSCGRERRCRPWTAPPAAASDRETGMRAGSETGWKNPKTAAWRGSVVAVAAITAMLVLHVAMAGARSGARFQVGAAVESFTPPAAGTLPNDPSDCVKPADSSLGA